MADRSAWWRTGTGIAAWVVLAVAASGAAWAAVDVVGDEADPPTPVAVRSSSGPQSGTPTPTANPGSETSPPDDPTTEPSATAPTETEPTETEPTETEPTAPGPTETEPTTEPATGTGGARTLASTGGTVAVECAGADAVRVLYATPSSGWQISVESRGPDEVEVEFLRGDAEVRVRAECDAGTVEADIDDD